jgi:hypothetical protein
MQLNIEDILVAKKSNIKSNKSKLREFPHPVLKKAANPLHSPPIPNLLNPPNITIIHFSQDPRLHPPPLPIHPPSKTPPIKTTPILSPKKNSIALIVV